MLVAVVEAVDVEAIKVEAVVNHLQTPAEWISAQLRMRWQLISVSGTWGRDSVSSATRRDTDCFGALN
jgi:hypothetical protein